MSAAPRLLLVMAFALAAVAAEAQSADSEAPTPATNRCDVDSLKPSPPLRAAARQDFAEAIMRANTCLGEKDAACAETAVASAQPLVMSDDERALLAITRADLARLRQDTGAAISIYREALALPEISDLLQREISWRLAFLHTARAEFAETLRLTASIGCDKWTAEALALRAMAYQELGARAVAIEGFEAAMRLFELEGRTVPNAFKGRYETLLTSEPLEPLPGTDVVALVRQNPDYPVTALQRRISGWVVLEFDVTENGAVANARILRSTNEIFDEISIATIQRWRYAPDFENGVPVGYTGQQTLLTFCLEPCSSRRNPPPERGPEGKYVLPETSR